MSAASPEPGRHHGEADAAPIVDIVVVAYNSRRHLRRCVESLAGHDRVRVVVVDNASADGCLELVSQLPLETIAMGRNAGFAAACNVGWRSGAAPFALFVNPDATLDSRSLWQLVESAEQHERAGAVAPLILGEDGELDFSLRRFPRLRSTYAQAFFLHRVAPTTGWTDELVRDRDRYDGPATVEWASGACLLVRRTALEQLGGFDERFFMYCEDQDLCRRLWDAGYEVRFEPRATCVHVGGASAPRPTLLSTLAESRLRYSQKHDRRLVRVLQRLGLALHALTHTLVSRPGFAARLGHLRALVVVVRGATASPTSHA